MAFPKIVYVAREEIKKPFVQCTRTPYFSGWIPLVTALREEEEERP